MRRCVAVLMVAGIGWAGTMAWGDAPTPTVTVTPTCTITPTFTVTPTVAPPVQVVSLDHNRFNPLKGEVVRVTSLRADHGTISVMVYNPSGVLVRRVVDRVDALSANPVWDGRNDQNEVVASGVYLVQVSGNKLHKRFRIVVLK